MTTSIITSQGIFTLDADLLETHSSPLRVTENPIESGSQIADNAILTPRPFELSGVMVDYNPTDTPFSNLADEYHIKEPDFIDSVPVPARLKSITQQTISLLNREVDLVAATASQLVGGESGQRAIAPWLPNLLPVDISDLTISDSRVRDAYAFLRSVQQSAIPVSISTDTTSYESALILNVRLTTTQEGSAEFNISCKEIFIVSTQTASDVTVPVGKTSGRTAAQTAKPVNKGTGGQSEVTGPVSDEILDRVKAQTGK